MQRYRECIKKDADGDLLSTGMCPDKDGEWVKYKDAIKEVEWHTCRNWDSDEQECAD